jgi:hypothetical protein
MLVNSNQLSTKPNLTNYARKYTEAEIEADREYKIKYKHERTEWLRANCTPKEFAYITGENLDDIDDLYCAIDLRWQVHLLRQKNPKLLVCARHTMIHSMVYNWLTDAPLVNMHGQRLPPGVLYDLKHDHSLVLPINLSHGDSMSIRFKTIREGKSIDQLDVRLDQKSEITVRVNDGVYKGWIQQIWAGSQMAFAVLLQGGSQGLTNFVHEVASDFFGSNLPKEISTFLPESKICFACHRPLKDEISKAIGHGPTCAKRLNIPHNLTVANEIVQKRNDYFLWLDLIRASQSTAK